MRALASTLSWIKHKTWETNRQEQNQRKRKKTHQVYQSIHTVPSYKEIASPSKGDDSTEVDVRKYPLSYALLDDPTISIQERGPVISMELSPERFQDCRRNLGKGIHMSQVIDKRSRLGRDSYIGRGYHLNDRRKSRPQMRNSSTTKHQGWLLGRPIIILPLLLPFWGYTRHVWRARTTQI